MTVYLLVSFAAIALIIIFIGLFLTNKSSTQTQEQPPRRRYAAATRSDQYRRRAALDVPYTSRHYAAYAEPVRESWSNVWELFAISRLFRRRVNDPTPWLGIVVILLACFWMGIMLLRTLAPNASIGAMFFGQQATQSSSSGTQNAPSPSYQASQALVRLSQLDPAQYVSQQQYDVWAYSACSTAAMTEVINSYGYHYRIADILKIEAQIGEITPQSGLLEDQGIARTVAHFGFKTSWGYSLSLSQIISIANSGRPVIVGWPPSRYTGGHLVVVVGGNSSTVYIADSSLYNRHALSYAQFNQWWGGFSAVVTPN